MPRYNLECVVLRNINYSDADKIYTLFSREKGKISASGKGVRKINSRRGGNLDTLNQVSIGISEGTSGYKIITEAKTIKSFKELKSDLGRSVPAYYMVELIDRFFEDEQENGAVYRLVLEKLAKLENHIDKRFVVLSFEIELMKLLGYALTLDRCSNCGSEVDDGWKFAKFDPAIGGIYCDLCAKQGIGLSTAAVNILSGIYKGDSSVVNGDLDSLGEVDHTIKLYIQEILEGSLRTERVFGE